MNQKISATLQYAPKKNPMKKPDISIVIPAYNEVETIPLLFSTLSEFVKSTSIIVQFVFVDDGSSDNTFDELCKQDNLNNCMKIVKLSKNFGAHVAIRAGILHADSEKVMIYSMDMPEPIENVIFFFNELNSGYEIVYSERIGYRGSLGSRIFGKLVNRFIEPTYPNDGLLSVAFGGKVKEQLNNNIEKNSSLFFQIFQFGFKKKGIPAVFEDRKAGESKWTLRKKIKLFIDSFVMFSYMPIRLITGIGMVLAVLGVLWALVTVILKIFNIIEFDAGWPTLTTILLVGFGITNMSLGIIAEYLLRTLDAARERPTFITDTVFCFDDFQTQQTDDINHS